LRPCKQNLPGSGIIIVGYAAMGPSTGCQLVNTVENVTQSSI
jgi:hypothetical protein